MVHYEAQIERKMYFKVKNFNELLKKIWRSLSVSYPEKLVKSISVHCQAIIDNEGDWIY